MSVRLSAASERSLLRDVLQRAEHPDGTAILVEAHLAAAVKDPLDAVRQDSRASRRAPRGRRRACAAVQEALAVVGMHALEEHVERPRHRARSMPTMRYSSSDHQCRSFTTSRSQLPIFAMRWASLKRASLCAMAACCSGVLGDVADRAEREARRVDVEALQAHLERERGAVLVPPAIAAARPSPGSRPSGRTALSSVPRRGAVRRHDGVDRLVEQLDGGEAEEMHGARVCEHDAPVALRAAGRHRGCCSRRSRRSGRGRARPQERRLIEIEFRVHYVPIAVRRRADRRSLRAIESRRQAPVPLSAASPRAMSGRSRNCDTRLARATGSIRQHARAADPCAAASHAPAADHAPLPAALSLPRRAVDAQPSGRAPALH